MWPYRTGQKPVVRKSQVLCMGQYATDVLLNGHIVKLFCVEGRLKEIPR